MSARELTITVLFQNGARSVYTMNSTETAAALLERVKSDPSARLAPDQVPKLLFLGRIIQPTDILGVISTSTEFTVQCFGQRERNSEAQPAAEPVKGFDRLTRVGYTAEQIAELRNAFHTVGRTSRLSQEEQLELEDEWVPALTLEGSPAAALRTIRLVNEFSGWPMDRFQTLPIGANAARASEEAESPLLHGVDEELEEENSGFSWAPFGIGVLCGLGFSYHFFVIVPFVYACNKLFALGLAYGMSLRILFSTPW